MGIQNALRLARTVDIELQDISGENWYCSSRYALEVHFTTPLDSALLADACQTGNRFVDSLLTEYQFYSCTQSGVVAYPDSVYRVLFTTDLYLNLNRLGNLMTSDPDVVYAGYNSLVVCDPSPYIPSVSLSIVDGVYTFKIIGYHSEQRIDWIVVVNHDAATLVSKTG